MYENLPHTFHFRGVDILNLHPIIKLKVPPWYFDLYY